MAAQTGGGIELLERALARNAVVKAGEPGRELYYFPKGSVGREQSGTSVESMSRKQERTAEEYEGYAAAIESFTNADSGASSSAGGAATAYDASLFGLLAGQAVAQSVQAGTPANLKASRQQMQQTATLSEKVTTKIDQWTGPALPD